MVFTSGELAAFILTDSDSDGIQDNLDNCPATPNANQSDVDNDSIGDPCDPNSIIDSDNDSVADSIDNCVSVFNSDQKDNDNDMQGNACDLTPNGQDNDNDGLGSLLDNCPDTSNPGQNDIDGNDIGDLCDNGSGGDLDGDGIINSRDVDITGGLDVNANGIDDSTEPDEVDSDFDGIVDGADNCPTVYNYIQDDTNGDGVGDACRIDTFGICGNESGIDPGSRFSPDVLSALSWGDNCGLQVDGEWSYSGYVLGIQTILSCMGYAVDIDGYYGPQTQSRVEAFQNDQGLAITGKVESETWLKLFDQLNLSSDGSRFTRYSVANCLVQSADGKSIAFDYDKDEIEWEILTIDVLSGNTSSLWHQFSTDPVNTNIGN